MEPARALEPYRLSKPEVAVFVAGITSMGLEILALRIVAPQFGSHIYTVGGLLTVFLAALSLGYWQGGKLAATASNRQMRLILLATAVYIAVVIYANDMLLLYTSTIPLPAQYASLPAVIVLFGPPTYLLGFISPYAAELSAKQSVGEASGHVYALGTIGSILGAGATTFVLIPTLSVDGIGLLFGLSLVATALVLDFPRPSRRTAVAVLAVTLVLFAATSSASLGLDPRGDVVYETQTPHQQLEVIDDGDERTMYLDGARHSAIDRSDPERHVFAYTEYFHLGMLLHENPEDVDRVLFIGGGGYTGPQDFEDTYDVEIDVVEIDPEVTAAAEAHFGLEQSDSLRAYTEPGRQFLQETDEEYDVIVLDAFKRDQVPFELTTVEFMTLAEERLADDGVLQANVISAPSGSASAFYRAQYATMNEPFDHVYSFRTSDSPAIQNIQLVATNGGERTTQEDLLERNDGDHLETDLEGHVGNLLSEPDVDDVPILEDDHAAVEALLDPMLGQQYVIEETDADVAADTNGSDGAGDGDASATSEHASVRGLALEPA